MGSWSETIMGGDTPYDAHEEILIAIGIPDDYRENVLHPGDDTPKRKVRNHLNKNLVLATDLVSGSYAHNTYYQVLGILIMRHGANMPDTLRQTIIDASHENTDDWKDPTTREAYLKDFRDKIAAYDGTPTFCTSEGLLDKVAQVLSKGGI